MSILVDKRSPNCHIFIHKAKELDLACGMLVSVVNDTVSMPSACSI